MPLRAASRATSNPEGQTGSISAAANFPPAIVVRCPSSATCQLEKHLRAFAGTEPVMLCQLTRSWKSPGMARSRLWMGELDMRALQNDLVRAEFITWGKTRWKSLDAAEVKAQLGEGLAMPPECIRLIIPAPLLRNAKGGPEGPPRKLSPLQQDQPAVADSLPASA
jgi:hypothetical protein